MKTKEEFINLRKERGNLATSQQRAAANPSKSVWVEASAGTGKTKVLSDRVLRLLLNGVNPQRILCLTYTKAAAVEMNTRISERLSDWAVWGEEDLEKSLFELLGDEIKNTDILKKYKRRARTLFAILLDTPGGIKIQTIHSFCQEVLKRFPLEAGISPYFDILDDESSKDALTQIQKELLEQIEDEKESPVKKAMQYLTENLTENSFPKVMMDITSNKTKIAEMLKNYKDKTDFDKALAQKLGIFAEETEKTAIDDFMAKINIADLRANIAALLQGGKKDAERAEEFERLLLQGHLGYEDYNKYKSLFLTKEGDLLKKQADKNSCAADSQVAERLQLEAERVLKNEEKLCKIRLYQATSSVLAIARELNNRYQDFKNKHSRLDYEDLILLTRNLLADDSVASWVLFKLDGGIDHILIDEAQDTSPNQWEIVKSLSTEFFAGAGSSEKKRTVFAVGDRKQSIYSFQGADPDKFDDMSVYFAQKAAADFQKINLAVSFRSSAAVLNTVNMLFSNPENSKGVTAVDETVNHIPFRAGEFGKVEIWPLLVAEKKDKEYNQFPPIEMSREVSVKNLLAKAMADKIKELVEVKHLHYRDIMVLVQTRSSFVNEFIRACKNKGVNISGADKLKLGEQIAVQDLISLGKFLLLNNDDLALAEVLKSPIFGLDDDDLLKLCYNRGKAPLWSRLGDFPEYSEVYNSLKILSDKIDYVRPYELFNYVLTTMDGRHKFTERMGMEVEDALDEFINLTISYEQEHIPSLQGFIDWIGRTEVEVKRETEQKDVDAVRLMTVHGSKGLQAPVVFLPDTVRIKNIKNEQALLWDNDMAYYPLNKTYYDNTCVSLKEENSRKTLEEYRRLLYVALTRAEDRLYICGFCGNKGADSNSWYKLCEQTLKANGVENGKNYEIIEPEVIAKKQKQSLSGKDIMPPLEDWVSSEAESESLLAKPYTPSRFDEEEDVDSTSPLAESGNYYRRGTLIHKLLQFLSQNSNDTAAIIDEYLAKNAADFSLSQKEQIKTEILNLFKQAEFSEIFGENSRAEVPIVGEVEGKIISAQLDRLIILPHKIMVVDFKTNRPAAKNLAETPLAYVNQLNTYAKLVQKIYSGKPVETYILWTNETRLMRVG